MCGGTQLLLLPWCMVHVIMRLYEISRALWPFCYRNQQVLLHTVSRLPNITILTHIYMVCLCMTGKHNLLSVFGCYLEQRLCIEHTGHIKLICSFNCQLQQRISITVINSMSERKGICWEMSYKCCTNLTMPLTKFWLDQCAFPLSLFLALSMENLAFI